jgi:glycosyltransferase involved in cell wall biosynthesis
MKPSLWLHFDELPPSGTAVSVRGKYFLEALVSGVSSTHNIVVTTSERSPESIPGVEIKTVGFRVRNPSRRFLARILDEVAVALNIIFLVPVYRRRPDLFVISSPGYITAMLVTFWLKCFKISYAWDIRDLYPEVFFVSGLFSPKSRLGKVLKSLMAKVYSHAAFLTTATETLAGSIEADNKRTVFNGFPKKLLKVRPPKFDEKTVVFHGNMGRYQDIEGYIRLALSVKEQRPEVRFLALGNGTKSYLFKNQSVVEYMGQKSHEETIRLISRCHVGVSPRNDDEISRGAFPVKVWEYIGLHIPVLTSPCSEAGVFLQKNRLGIQLSNIADDQAVKYLLELIDASRSVGNNPGLEKFTRESQAILFAEMVRECVNG